MLTKEVIDDAFKSSVGSLTAYDLNNGTQLVELEAKSTPINKVRLAILEHKVVPSNQTQTDVYNAAKAFAVVAEKGLTDFVDAAKKDNYQVRNEPEVLQSAQTLGTVTTGARQIIRWAFNNKEGKISDVFECGDQFVIAAIVSQNNTGYRSLTSVSPTIKSQLLRDKKAEILISQIADKMKQNKDLTALATALGVDVKQATGVNFNNPALGEAGQEPAVVGRVSAMQLNEISQPVKGNAGVYVVQVTAQKADTTANAVALLQQINSKRNYYVPYMLMQDLVKNTKVVDNRLRFF